MDKFLEGKRALVTGGSKGIGYATAKKLAEYGARVAICARSAHNLTQGLEKLKGETGQEVFGQTADVSRNREVESLFAFVDKSLGGLDILVNNAGVGTFRPVGEMSVDEWDRVIAVNLSGAFYCTRQAITRFSKSGGGHIINISSLAGKNPFAGGGAYNASKFGMNGFSEATMLDHRNDNVRVSYVMPGSVATEFGGPGGTDSADWKIGADDVAEIVSAILKMPERTLISRVEVRPSRPRKS